MTVEVSVTQKLDESVVPLGTKNGIELAILRRAEKTLVKIIAKPDSSDLIDGVRIEPLQVYPDDRGFFMELARLGEGLATPMVPWKFYARQVASAFALHPSQRSKRGGRRKGQPTQCFPPRVCTRHGFTMRHWKTALSAYLQELRQKTKALLEHAHWQARNTVRPDW